VKAIKEEIKMIKKNKTWELVGWLENKEVIGVKWSIKQSLTLMAQYKSIKKG